ncbi:hypothetical protein [Xanthomonas sp. A1809]|uniref:hypothetical protein n=1 Tax=Xanthomonas sp. A1809 TaxID=2821275 RepID=UPI001ADA0214|nr:hypothetical protein [Xanthomonas sp. A1809]MBO9858831.1 hypothetical protein [Xanthomonas sp. A1809]
MQKGTPTDLCRLCGLHPTAEKSHIIPAFVGRRAKAAGKNRLVTLRGRRVFAQDTLKLPFLCESCEDLFGDLEGPFSRTWFSSYPNVPGSSPDASTVRFYLSVAWRVLRYLLEKNKIPHLYVEDARSTEHFMRTYLNSADMHPPEFNSYIFFASDFDGLPEAPPQELLCLAAGFGMVLFEEGDAHFFSSKMPAIVSLIGPFIHVLELQTAAAHEDRNWGDWSNFRLIAGKQAPRGTPPFQLTRWLAKLLGIHRDDFLDDQLS